jgi:hypothetical protein
MKKIAWALLFVLTAWRLPAAGWKTIERIEVEVFTAEKTAWTLEYSLGKGIYRKTGGTGRQVVALVLRELDTKDNDIMCSVKVDVISFPEKDTLVGVALRVFRKGNIVEQITGPACRTSEYGIEYSFKKYT